MSFLKKPMKAKDKKIVIYLVMLAVAGILLMMWGRTERFPMQGQERTGQGEPFTYGAQEHWHESIFHEGNAAAHQTSETASRPERSERYLEEELEAFLTLVAGAGHVRVMVSAFGDKETVFVTDSTSSRSHIIEEDAEGGTRDQRQYTNQEQTVIIRDQSGTDRPLVKREITPRVEGIVIIAEGGDDPFVRDALSRAAITVLGVEPHRVHVLPMQ